MPAMEGSRRAYIMAVTAPMDRPQTPILEVLPPTLHSIVQFDLSRDRLEPKQTSAVCDGRRRLHVISCQTASQNIS